MTTIIRYRRLKITLDLRIETKGKGSKDNTGRIYVTGHWKDFTYKKSHNPQRRWLS